MDNIMQDLWNSCFQIPVLDVKAIPVSQFHLFWIFTITNDVIFAKKISRVVKPILKVWWTFHRNLFVSYGDKNFQTFSLKSQIGSFEGCEIRNFINLALYCPWIILFNKGCCQTLSQKSKIQKSLFAISMQKFGKYYFHN